MSVEIDIDASKWHALERRYQNAGGKNIDRVLMRAVNHTGKKARTKMVRSLAAQSGLPIKTTRKALKAKQASGGAGGGSFVIKSGGGNIRLKFFKARETARGVVASPWNKRRLYAQAFTRGGQRPNRVALKFGGEVKRRAGAGRLPLKTQKSGLYIPKEMVTGQTEQAFYATAKQELAKRMVHELGFILGKA